MDRTETIKIMAVLRAAYPQYYAKQSSDDLQSIVTLWAEMFADEPYSTVAMAVKALIKTRASTFPPGIGEINEKIMQITQPEEMTELEAWALVSRATRNAAYHSQREFDNLPPVVQRVVGSPEQLKEWSQMDSDTVNSVVASNFQRSYRARAKNERDFLALPSEIRQMLSRPGVTNDIDALPSPEEQKNRALTMLAQERAETQRQILGDEFDHPKHYAERNRLLGL